MESRNALIDTSLFIDHIRAKDKAATTLKKVHSAHITLLTSSIVAAELCYGARSKKMRSDVMALLSISRIIPFTEEMACRLSEEAEKLKLKNAMIGFRDLAIACVAMEESLPLATLNLRDFTRVEGLKLLDLTRVQLNSV